MPTNKIDIALKTMIALYGGDKGEQKAILEAVQEYTNMKSDEKIDVLSHFIKEEWGKKIIEKINNDNSSNNFLEAMSPEWTDFYLDALDTTDENQQDLATYIIRRTLTSYKMNNQELDISRHFDPNKPRGSSPEM